VREEQVATRADCRAGYWVGSGVVVVVVGVKLLGEETAAACMVS
jgi:hypothetical protein